MADVHSIRICTLKVHPVEDSGVDRLIPQIQFQDFLPSKSPEVMLDQGNLALTVILGRRSRQDIRHHTGDIVPSLALPLSLLEVQVIGGFIFLIVFQFDYLAR